MDESDLAFHDHDEALLKRILQIENLEAQLERRLSRTEFSRGPTSDQIYRGIIADIQAESYSEGTDSSATGSDGAPKRDRCNRFHFRKG